MPYLTKMENDIRLMIMTVQQPLNEYMVYKARNHLYARLYKIVPDRSSSD